MRVQSIWKANSIIPNRSKQLVFEISVPPPPALDNFVAGGNAELLHMLHDMLARRQAERFVYIWGEAGSGKSHLLQAFVNAAGAQQLRTAYVACKNAAPLDVDLAACDVVVVDDVAGLDAGAQGVLFDIYNRMRDGGGLLLSSGPQAPAHLELRRDLATRLGAGLVYQVHGLTDDDKALALKTHARGRGFTLSQEAADYLLRYWKRDLPSLLAVLDALDRYSLETKRPVTLPLLREVLQYELNLGNE